MLQRAQVLLSRHGDSSLDGLRLTRDKSLYFGPGARSYLAYREAAGCAVVLGDPIGPADHWASLIDGFQQRSQDMGLKPVFCGITADSLPFFRNLGFSEIKVGDDALVNLDDLSLKGRHWREVRAALNRGRSRGISFRYLPWQERTGPILESLHQVSRQWLSSKPLPELTFGLGTEALVGDYHTRVAAAFAPDGRMEGFVTWLPSFGHSGWTLDMMRRRPDAMPGLMDFLIGRSLLSMREEGVKAISLGAVPFSNVPREPGGFLRKALDLLFWVGSPAYTPRKLLHFKDKFNPLWSPLYMVCPPGTPRPWALWATLNACMPEASSWRGIVAFLKPA